MQNWLILWVGVFFLTSCGQAASSQSVSKVKGNSKFPPECESILGAQPGLSIHEVVGRLGPPTRVFLADEEAEFPHPKATDNLFLIFDREVQFSRLYHASIIAVVAPGGCVANRLTVNLGNPMESTFKGEPEQEILARFGAPARSFRRRIETEVEGPEALISNCEDPAGSMESWLYPDRCLEVRFYRASDRKEGFFLRIDPAIPNEPALLRCGQRGSSSD